MTSVAADGNRVGGVLVPVSAPTNQRLRPDWEALLRLAEQRRLDIVELSAMRKSRRSCLSQFRSIPRLNGSHYGTVFILYATAWATAACIRRRRFRSALHNATPPPTNRPRMRSISE